MVLLSHFQLSQTLTASRTKLLKLPAALLACVSLISISSGNSHAFVSEKGGDGWTIELGFGSELEPQFAGSSNRQVEPSAYLSIAYRSGNTLWYTSLLDNGVYHAFGSRWIIGLSAGFELGRDEDDDAALAGLGNIDDTYELRLDLAYQLNDDLTLATRAMTAGADKDNVYFLAAIYDVPLPFEKFDLTFTTDLSWGSTEHLRTEFGVNAEQAANSAYPLYEPTAGVKSIGASFSGDYRINNHLFAYGEIGYERYDDAGSLSPFTDNDYDIESEIGIKYRF
jgi:outer membrane scaffolding protein for murein synthesis (MipA/OmpV family)